MDNHQDWWISLNHSGLLITPAELVKFEGPLPALRQQSLDYLRIAIQRHADKPEELPTDLFDQLFSHLTPWDRPLWETNPGSTYTLLSITGRPIKPWRLLTTRAGDVLPVFVPEKDDRARQGALARDRKFNSRVLEWLRRRGQSFALVTNGLSWRLVMAGPDYEAWCEWDLKSWFVEGGLGPQAEAWRRLLADPAKTLEAIRSSRQAKGTLTRDLGERVRKAVELLISSQSDRLQVIAPTEENRRALYLAAVRLVMRCVVILFAEARDLLPRSNPVYALSYSLEALRSQLKTRRLTHGSSLQQGRQAWPRLMSLFRLVYEGSSHEALPLPKYGGGLFEPGNKESSDPVKRALGVLEDPFQGPSDASLTKVFSLLSETNLKVKQGRTWVKTTVPVDFSDLSSEYIGILYEGLLDFELRQAPSDDAVIFLNIGDQPALNFKTIDAMTEGQIKELYKALKKANKNSSDDEDDLPEDIPPEEMEEPEGDDDPEPPVEEREEGDLLADAVRGWALRTCQTLGLRRKKGEAEHEFHERERKESEALIKQILHPGEWYLVRWGGTRKGAGTFYTPPGLAAPTVERTLWPNLYVGEGEAAVPKLPEEILSLKVADIAMGSGSFLISALRVITEAIYRSLWHHGRLNADGGRTLVRLADGRALGDLSEDPLPMPQTSQEFEGFLKGRLKRHIVERCLYGLDLDPLAVELARLSLWVETMDYNLPFGFLDHKLKCGNSLVGARFADLPSYPAHAFSREGPTKTHSWTEAYKTFRNDVLKPELISWIEGTAAKQFGLGLVTEDEVQGLHDQAAKTFDRLHALKIHEVEERERIYRDEVINDSELRRFRDALNLWCALWFWPGNQMALAPSPRTWKSPSEDQWKIVHELAQRERFFHWELEFPDVFTTGRQGFDVLVGNPPWETMKPNSKEFFSNLDPLYRTYGKQAALSKQKELFDLAPSIEVSWDIYQDRFKALSNWIGTSSNPWGDPEIDESTKISLGRGRSSELLHGLWRDNGRPKVPSFRGGERSFVLQGGGDLNSYKLFLEQIWTLLGAGGRFGMVVPGSIYSDEGSGGLRREFLERGQWEWLFSFENREKVFEIDSRFKFCVLVVSKGGSTQAVKTSFMNRTLDAWARPKGLAMSPDQIKKFSPNSLAFLEVQSQKDIVILEKIYENSILLGDKGPEGWGIKYSTEFHMTNDSHLFKPIQDWEAKGYRGDEYGHWLLGNWVPYEGPRPTAGPVSPLARPEKTILSADKNWVIHWDDVRDVALPLYEGRMIGQFDFSAKGWVSGKGRGAVWREIDWTEKTFEPQYLMASSVFSADSELGPVWRLAFKDVTSSTNTRSFYGTVVPPFPCNHKTPVFTFDSFEKAPALLSILNSTSLDHVLRIRLSANSLVKGLLEELPTPKPDDDLVKSTAGVAISLLAASMRYWNQPTSPSEPFTPHERLRLRIIIDVIVALAFGHTAETYGHVLANCGFPVGFAPSCLPSKGFWRVDQDVDPELRFTVLAQIAFAELLEVGIESFLAANGGQGWQLPETIRLADYGLGHDERAKVPQPVASRLGPRFFEWQLNQNPETVEQERLRHADNIAFIRAIGAPTAPAKPETKQTQGQLDF